MRRMAPPGIEVLAGVVYDPQFGPTIACGAGGTLVELLKDISVRLSPLTRSDAASMLHELRSLLLLQGYRGAPQCDISALEEVLVRISALADHHPQIAELDCNPVIVSATGRSSWTHACASLTRRRVGRSALAAERQVENWVSSQTLTVFNAMRGLTRSAIRWVNAEDG